MVKIDLQEYYPHYYSTSNTIDVSCELAAWLLQYDRDESAAARQRYRYKAHYSLDCNDGIEHDILFKSPSPCEIYERESSNKQLYAALSKLPNKQRRRIYAHYFLGMSITAIAHAEGVSCNVVCVAIKRGLKSMERLLKKDFL